MHPALAHVAHRAWPLPSRPWSLTMDWEDLLFLHKDLAYEILWNFVRILSSRLAACPSRCS